ncbi:MAG: hypothetical protein ACREIV_13360 [Planctomycetaceae bacterium]
MSLQRFTVILANVSEMTDDLADALYAAGCDDGVPCSRDGQAYVHFDRDAPTLRDAIRSAVADVRRAGLQPLRMEIGEKDLAELVDDPAAQPK